MDNKRFAPIELNAEELQRSQAALDELKAVLGPKLSSLSYEQRRSLPRMGDGSEPFVEKTVVFSQTNPEFLPGFVNPAYLQLDYQAVSSLNSLYRPLLQLVRQLDDSIMISGSEAYSSSLAYYSNVKRAARRGVGTAKPIYEELRLRFNRRKPAPEDEGSSG